LGELLIRKSKVADMDEIARRSRALQTSLAVVIEQVAVTQTSARSWADVGCLPELLLRLTH
jgi:hypothetical protein